MRILDLAAEAALVRSSAAALGWDQETYLPPRAVAYRAKQLSWLAARAHTMATSPEWQAALDDAEASDDGSDARHTANLRALRRDLDRATRIPSELVARASEVTSLAKHAWAEARRRNDFASFAPHLSKVIGINREKAEHWGYADVPYDALLESYERGATTRELSALFDSIRSELRAIAAAAVDRSSRVSARLPAGPYPVAAQVEFNRKVAECVGFDFSAGRIDTTNHPFCTTLGPRDIRMTTRYDETDFTSSLFGVLHESGHGLYEQGLPEDAFGQPAGDAVSLGIHESQSRLWENHIGRSRAFWEIWYPEAVRHFPALAGFPLESFLSWLHQSSFSTIRVESDEATYDLHILLRFDIEQRLLHGTLDVGDLPAAWNEGFRDSFGFTPPNDTEGCLQDIHWSMGAIGYFPTYSLGNFNAAQLFRSATADPSIAGSVAKGDYAPLLCWLRDRVHRHGALLDPAEVIRSATGEAPSTDAYLAHLRNRYAC